MVIHIRDRVVVDDTLVKALAPVPGEEVILVGREVLLAGAQITDRAVTIVADELRAGVGQPNLTVAHSQAAQSSVHSSRGQIEPPIPVVESQTAQPGLAGFQLTVLANSMGASTAVSHGQTGGKGRLGRDENRNACQMTPDSPDHPCRKLSVKNRDFLEGPQGGPGGRGADGGPPGPVSITCGTSFLAGPDSWRGAGGTGGAGGDGGEGGTGAGWQASQHHGPAGPEGAQGTTPAPKNAAVAVVGEAGWIKAVRDTDLDFRWASFRHLQAAHLLRCAGPLSPLGPPRIQAVRDELEAVTTFQSGGILFPLIADQLRQVVDENGLEFDLDIVPEVDLYDDRRARRAKELRASLESIATIAPGIGQTIAAKDALAGALTSLLSSGGSYTKQDNAAAARLTRANTARTVAARTIEASVLRLANVLGPGQVVTAAGVNFDQAGVNDLAARFRALIAPAAPADTQPSGYHACALPAAPHLLVNRVRRDTRGPFDFGLPFAMGGVIGLAERTRWTELAAATSDTVIDIAAVALSLRSAAGPRMARDLLVELAEAVRTWLLADLRIEHARFAATVVAANRKSAEKTLANLPLVSMDSFESDVNLLLDAATVVADALRYDTARAQRAASIYSLDLTAPPLKTYAGASDPAKRYDLADFADLSARGVVASHLNTAIIGTTQTMLTSYLDRGTQLARQDAAGARITFCAPEADPACGATAPEVFARLRSDSEAGFWFDASLAHINGPHTEAKVTGAKLTVTFDSSETTPVEFNVHLVHQGFSAQRDLRGKEHSLTALPALIDIRLQQTTTAGTEGSPDVGNLYCEGEKVRTEPTAPNPGEEPEPTLEAYGRGLAAGWRFELQNLVMDNGERIADHIRRIDIDILYETLQDSAIVNVRRVEMATSGLRAGGTARGRITLTGKAPANGLEVKLASSDPSILQVPAAVVVPPGQTTTEFAATALKDSAGDAPTLTVRTADGATRRARIPVAKAVPPSANQVRLGPAAEGMINCVTVLPAAGPQAPARVLASMSRPVDPAGPAVTAGVHVLQTDLKTVTVGTPEHPRSIAVDRGRNAAYVIHGFDVSRLDLTTMKPVATHHIGVGVAHVAVDPGAGLVYVSNVSHHRIDILSADDLTLRDSIGNITTLAFPFGLALDAARGRLYVARGGINDQVTAFAVSAIQRRPDGSHVIEHDRRFEGPFFQPVDVACDPVAGLVYVSSLGNPTAKQRLVVLTSSLRERGQVIMPSNAHGVAARPGTGLAYVATQSGLLLVDARALQILLTVKTGPFPFTVDVDPADGTAYVGDLTEHTVTRVRFPKEVPLTIFR